MATDSTTQEQEEDYDTRSSSTLESEEEDSDELNQEKKHQNEEEEEDEDENEEEEEEDEDEEDENDVRETLRLLQKMEQKERAQWQPTLGVVSSYSGNGFVTITIVECNSSVSAFELKYCFTTNDVDVSADAELADKLEFHIEQLRAQKISQNRILLRIPQQLYDYRFLFQLRCLAIKRPIHPMFKPFASWTDWTELASILVPADAPEHQYEENETVSFQLPNSPFWSLGKVIKIEQDSHGKEIADIQYQQKGKQDETYKVAVEGLKLACKERSKLVDLADWMQLSLQLFFNDVDRNKETEQAFIAVFDTLYANFAHYIYECEDSHDPERLSVIELVWNGEIQQDIQCCARFITLNVMQFLQQSQSTDSDADQLAIDNGISIGCGLCPVKNHHKTRSRLRNLWQYKLTVYTRYHIRTGELNEGNALETFDRWLQSAMLVYCDICMVGFHHMDYLYCCDSTLDEQHDICMPCMNRNVLQYQRLSNTLNDLYDVHELDKYCVAQIVYCLVGLIR